MNFYNDLMQVELAQPIWLYLYLVVLAIMSTSKVTIENILQRIHPSYNYKHTYFNEIQSILIKQQSLYKSRTLPIHSIVSAIIMGLIFLSLANPYINGKQLPPPPNNRDILFIVDNEVGMVLKDYFIDGKRVERLTMVKSVLLNFTQKLSGNRIGIITFSEKAHTLLPLTTDSNLIKKMIPRIEATLTGRTSNPQNALIYTLNYLHNLRSDNKKYQKPTLVLLTDVLRPPRDIDPNIVSQYIGKKGYKLYVVAIGASTYKTSDVENSTLIYHPASFDRLKEMAKYANGDFYWAKNTDSLNNIIENILKTKKTKVAIKKQYENIPLFHWPLGIALLLIVIQYLTGSFVYRSRHA